MTYLNAPMPGSGPSTIEFFVEPITPQILGVGVRINGIDLRTIASGGVLVGVETLGTRHWSGLAHPNFAPDAHFSNDNDEPLDRRHVVAVLNCDCGILDCGGLFTRVRQFQNEVRWTEFRRGLGTSADIDEISFYERQYFTALRHAKDEAHRRVADGQSRTKT